MPNTQPSTAKFPSQAVGHEPSGSHAPNFGAELQKALSGLNAAQREAAETLYGPVVVIAGPGTGKTQIVACRAANILAKTDAKPENLLITTFTEAGVVSIKKRLLKFL